MRKLRGEILYKKIYYKECTEGITGHVVGRGVEATRDASEIVAIGRIKLIAEVSSCVWQYKAKKVRR